MTRRIRCARLAEVRHDVDEDDADPWYRYWRTLVAKAPSRPPVFVSGANNSMAATSWARCPETAPDLERVGEHCGEERRRQPGGPTPSAQRSRPPTLLPRCRCFSLEGAHVDLDRRAEVSVALSRCSSGAASAPSGRPRSGWPNSSERFQPPLSTQRRVKVTSKAWYTPHPTRCCPSSGEPMLIVAARKPVVKAQQRDIPLPEHARPNSRQGHATRSACFRRMSAEGTFVVSKVSRALGKLRLPSDTSLARGGPERLARTGIIVGDGQAVWRIFVRAGQRGQAFS